MKTQLPSAVICTGTVNAQQKVSCSPVSGNSLSKTDAIIKSGNLDKAFLYIRATHTIKKIFLISLCLALNVLIASAQQKVKDGTVTNGNLPNKDALLELESANKGLLHARVALRITTDAFPLSTHVAGMMVYNTTTQNDVVPGIYYNDGTKWILAKGGASSGLGLVQNMAGRTGIPGQPGQQGGPGAGVAIVTNDSGTWLYNAATQTWTSINGPAGRGISSAVTNSDGTITFTYTDGTSSTTSSLKGVDGATGPAGKGISSVITNADGTITFTYTDGTSNTTSSLKGADGAQGVAGIQGPQGAAGRSIISAAGAPGAGTGKDGDAYVDTSTGDIYANNGGTWTKTGSIKGADGVAGTNGTNGTNGADGKSVIGAAGAPGAGTGKDGDAYVDTSTGDIYANNGGTWTKTGSIKGADGIAGTNGTNGTNGADGKSVIGAAGAPGAGTGKDGDTYVDTSTGDIYSNTGGSWAQTGNNIRGPQGNAGNTGNAGPIGPQGDPGETGQQGSTGLTGPAGPAGPIGPEGSPGQDGQQGSTGLTGPAGPAGPIGPEGSPGQDGSQGPTGLTGPAGPAGPIGPEGSPGQDGPAGLAGATGPQGAVGADGKSLLSGSGAAVAGTGKDGDTYVDTTTGDVYANNSGTWTKTGSIKGANGAAGTVNVVSQPGTSGTPNTPGQQDGPPVGTTVVINDSGGWVYDPTTTTWTSINGPQGISGPIGPGGISATVQDNGDGTVSIIDGFGISATVKDGKSVIGAAGAPDSGTGKNGDTYIDTSTGDVYSNTGGNWTQTGNNIRGPVGSAGPIGPQGFDGMDGPEGPEGPPGIGGKTTVGTGLSITGTGGSTSPYLIKNTGVVSADNGLISTNGNVQLGGALTKATTITTSPANTLTLSGLQPTAVTTGTDNILVTDGAGLVKTMPQSTLNANNWQLLGNTGTTPGTNYLGTTDAQDLVVKTNAAERLRVTSAGNIDIPNSTITTGIITKGGLPFIHNMGSRNTAVGLNALALGGGDDNIAFGINALALNTGGSRNIAIGTGTLGANTTGLYNVAIGRNALSGNQSGSYNFAMGWNSLVSIAGTTDGAQNGLTGSYNTAIGVQTLASNGTGMRNVAIGYQAGNTNLGSGNIFLGTQAGFTYTGSNRLMIDNSNTNTPLLDGDFTGRVLTINKTLKVADLASTAVATSGNRPIVADANGQLMIGTAAPSTEPWFIQNTTNQAIANTDNIFTTGTVAIGKNQALTGAALDIYGAVRGGTNLVLGNTAGDVGANSVAFGEGNTASGQASGAWGANNKATELYATAFGWNNTAFGYTSTAFGDSNTASSANSTVWGSYNTINTTADKATVFGDHNIASGNGSTVFGTFNTAGSKNETVFGTYAAITQGSTGASNGTDPLLQIGNGSTGAPSNALTVLKNSYTGIGITGTEATAKPTEQLDIGSGNVKIRGINSNTGLATDNIVVADVNGVLKTKAAVNSGTAIGTQTADYTALPADETILVDATAGTVTIKLPATPVTGKKYNIKKIDSSGNTAMMDGNGHNIDGTATISGNLPYQGWTVQFDGTNWYIISRI